MLYIDNDKEHVEILYMLGILDDEEDWPLYQKMKDEEPQIDSDTWFKYQCSGRLSRGGHGCSNGINLSGDQGA